MLILDEPTVGVDPQSRNAIFDSPAMLVQLGFAALFGAMALRKFQRDQI